MSRGDRAALSSVSKKREREGEKEGEKEREDWPLPAERPRPMCMCNVCMARRRWFLAAFITAEPECVRERERTPLA